MSYVLKIILYIDMLLFSLSQNGALERDFLLKAKQFGFSDKQIAKAIERFVVQSVVTLIIDKTYSYVFWYSYN